MYLACKKWHGHDLKAHQREALEIKEADLIGNCQVTQTVAQMQYSSNILKLLLDVVLQFSV